MSSAPWGLSQLPSALVLAHLPCCAQVLIDAAEKDASEPVLTPTPTPAASTPTTQGTSPAVQPASVHPTSAPALSCPARVATMARSSGAHPSRTFETSCRSASPTELPKSLLCPTRVPVAPTSAPVATRAHPQSEDEASAAARVKILEEEMARMKAETKAALQADAQKLRSMEEALRASEAYRAAQVESQEAAGRFNQAKADGLLRTLSEMLYKGSLTQVQVRQVDLLAQKDDPLVLGAYDQFKQTGDVAFFLKRLALILRCS